ncbi:piggyBac transposable element-derived protein 4-like [Siniperca chuatsi]|uniref:piggyBac transposable element-derived protein 4-like n=1 Tax=Siniperca chuatsi TaxID=119488 RepID=UPI001CE089AC|nr:piggyBac transposable element-derived protein 4-like [Siniperca chuatsi]
MSGISAKNFYPSSRKKNDPAKLSLSRAEQLLMAIANNSEVEDLSDGEDNDPAVDEVILQDVDLMDEHPDFSPPDSGDDSGEEYTPPDAAEDTDSENESQPNHPQVHRRGRKQQHIENDELDEEDQRHGEPRPEPRNAGRGERWRSAPFRPNLVQFQDGDDGLKDERTGWQPLDYVEQYIDSDLMKLIADCTNAMSLGNSGRSLSTSVDEIYHFFGAAILMSCVPYPQIRMFWSNALQIPAISNTMSRDRFFKLRSHLKVVIDYDVSEDKRETDKFWKVRPFMDRILTGCRLQVRPKCVSIDEQMIPFTGACPFRQYVPLKPNPVGMKNFVLASVDGLVLDFEVYQVDHMLKDDIYLTGTVMKGRVKQAMNKLPDDKTLKHQGRGAVSTVTRADGKLCVVKWYDNKPVVMLSTVHSEQPEDTCQRWSKKGKKYVTVTRPSIVREYNSKMGGVDMSDRMMSYYRMSVRTKKWTIRMLMHFMDLALANSWLLYRRDNQENGTPRKSIMKFLEFRMVVAQVFLSKCDVLHEGAHVTEEENENGHLPPPGKNLGRSNPHISVRSSAAHLRRWWP